MKHTSGPWSIDRFTPSGAAMIRSEDRQMWLALHVGQLDSGEHAANARLIAAAPELLEALRLLCDRLHEGRKFNVKKDSALLIADSAARAAIHKATEDH